MWWMIPAALAGTGPTNGDIDGDGLPDAWEDLLGTQVYAPDTDGDTIPDLFDLVRAGPTAGDADGDGLNDLHELAYRTRARGWDTDDDGLEDGEEVRLGANPHQRDTDGDGIPDGADALGGLDPRCPGRWHLMGPAPVTVQWAVFDPHGSGGSLFESVLRSDGSRTFGFQSWQSGDRAESRYGWLCTDGALFCSSSTQHQTVSEFAWDAGMLEWNDNADMGTYTSHLALVPGEERP